MKYLASRSTTHWYGQPHSPASAQPSNCCELASALQFAPVVPPEELPLPVVNEATLPVEEPLPPEVAEPALEPEPPLETSSPTDKQQPAARWIEEIAELTVSAVVWSGTQLKIIPYGDQPLSANGASWTPDLTWQFSLGDDDFLPWSESGGGSDPVLLTRADPAQATNWLSIEYLDAANGYNPQVIATFDQGAIDAYGLRTQPSVQAHSITNPASAAIAAQLMLQRRLYLRNTLKFKLGWRYALLEPMDIVLISDAALGLSQAPVRIIQIEEDQNGELTITAEEIPGVTP